MTANDDLAPAIAAFQHGDLERALQFAQRLVEGGAGTASADHLLGLIHCRLGDLERGTDHLRRAVAAEPANFAYQVMLARALVDCGRASEVLQMPLPPRDTRPETLAAWSVRAEAAQAVGHWVDAAEAWRVLAAARPGDWRAHASLGNALAAVHQWPGAVETLERAASLNSSDPTIRRALATARGELQIEHARALVALARFDEAEQQYRAVLAVDSDNRAAVHELGLLLERTGQLGELRALVDGASAALIGQLGYLRAVIAFRDGDPVTARQLLMEEKAEDDPVRWHRLMIRIADALGDTGLAFSSALAMNQAVPGFDQWRDRGASYRQRIRSIAQRITPDWAQTLPQTLPADRRSPAFLVGFPRSGTTLLDTFLMGHPGVRVLEEIPMLDSAEKVIGHVGNLHSADTAQVKRARDAYFAHLDRHVESHFRGLVVDKLPLNMLGMPLIGAMFPDARVIFAQRHPCDVVLSGFMQSFVVNDAMACFLDLADAADLYDAVLDVWARSTEALTLPVHRLVYEDLVADAETALKPLIDFLELDWRPELLDHRSTAKRRGAISTPSYDQVTEALSRAPSGRWRRYEKELAPVLPVLLPWARRLAYPD